MPVSFCLQLLASWFLRFPVSIESLKMIHFSILDVALETCSHSLRLRLQLELVLGLRFVGSLSIRPNSQSLGKPRGGEHSPNSSCFRQTFVILTSR
ncbi:hypothetical protein JG688_00008239 [Phytophthora aleatoria]|uniref:Secreted protein n=1 Tax=Phytophthora aleatoria TaxID=2496075 RepID=A0A8J5M7I9_9STRA|nr:hypothetical protein JG688_00008239 [Phytophthora aleatoria]